jgi:hypothetical protein
MTMLLLLVLTLSNKQQARHDSNEWKMSQELQADEAVIASMWRPPSKLLADYGKAKKCYVQFHLYKAQGCDHEFQEVERELGEVEMARTEER